MPATIAGGADRSVTYDTVAPTVTVDQSAGQADPTNVRSAIRYTVVFSEPVTGVVASDFTVGGTASGVTTNLWQIIARAGLGGFLR